MKCNPVYILYCPRMWVYKFVVQTRSLETVITHCDVYNAFPRPGLLDHKLCGLKNGSIPPKTFGIFDTTNSSIRLQNCYLQNIVQEKEKYNRQVRIDWKFFLFPSVCFLSDIRLFLPNLLEMIRILAVAYFPLDTVTILCFVLLLLQSNLVLLLPLVDRRRSIRLHWCLIFTFRQVFVGLDQAGRIFCIYLNYRTSTCYFPFFDWKISLHRLLPHILTTFRLDVNWGLLSKVWLSYAYFNLWIVQWNLWHNLVLSWVPHQVGLRVTLRIRGPIHSVTIMYDLCIALGH